MSVDAIKIETYWNVNRKYTHSFIFPNSIKIETYWNVNAKGVCFSRRRVGIKIETYWNVNRELLHKYNLMSKLKWRHIGM